jgi:serine-type D-Ala-D-Ala carboxypeptidase/endopeptidase (penicillin-binding protein 4)
MKIIIAAIFLILIISFQSASQELVITKKIKEAYRIFLSDTQLVHAMSSLYVIDGVTNQVIIDNNSQIGLAPASTQKIITSVTAFELLGKNYQYKTEFNYAGVINNRILNGDIVINGSGDPTLGSWRWDFTKEEIVINKVLNNLRKLGIKSINSVQVNQLNWETNMIPDGWIWQDIGNYYGAGANKFNWRENQFDVILKSGQKVGDPVSIIGYKPKLYSYNLTSQLTSAPEGTGDNAYIYFSFNSSGTIRGTIPVEESHFLISGAIPSPVKQFVLTLEDSLKRNKISYKKDFVEINKQNSGVTVDQKRVIPIYTHYSPILDSIIFWFNRRSINLYGEALVKTFAFEKQGKARTDSGIAIVKNFWKQKGLDPDELNIYDGSGLSPLNRVTTHAQVEILKYAKKQPWFDSFYESLPVFNGIKMKSGTISDVKGFMGYNTSKDGNQYIFAFLVNNYMGSSSELVRKMYKVLDILK